MEQHRYSNEPKKDAFSAIAVWQVLTFILLLCFIWASEILNLPARVFGGESEALNIYRACITSAAVIVAGIVAVGHTYERQKSIVKELLKTCLYCHRVKSEDGEWEHVEEYFIRNFPVDLERGSCPDCESMISSVEDRQDIFDSVSTES